MNEENKKELEGNNEELQKELEKTLEELEVLSKDDNANVNEIKQKIQKLKDGTEILKGEFDIEDEDDSEPELTMKQKKAIYRFVNNLPKHKEVSDETINKLTDEEYERMMKIGDIKLKQLSYFPKKKFGKAYKKKRQHRNKLAKKARQTNARK